MKFDEMEKVDGNDKKKKSYFIPILIVVCVLVFGLIIYSVTSSKKGSGKLQELDPNSRLVQSLYVSVHDFKSTSPYWMYDGENSSNIADMTDGNKMVLAYLNLKGSDFLEPDDCSILPEESSYGRLLCTNKTIVKKEDMERSFKEVFGDKVTMPTDIIVKVDPKDELYVYNSEFDSYLLYSAIDKYEFDKLMDAHKGNYNEDKEAVKKYYLDIVAQRRAKRKKFSKTFKYNYNVYKAEKEGDVIRVYEDLTVERAENGTLENQSKYLYTFVLGEDNLYSYTSIEKIN